MKLPEPTDRADAPAGANAIVLEAIVRRRCLSATYNRTRLILAPHVLYMRNDALHVDAITVSREMMAPKIVKMGTYKLDGLSELRVVEREFAVSELFAPDDPKYAATLMAVEPD